MASMTRPAQQGGNGGPRLWPVNVLRHHRWMAAWNWPWHWWTPRVVWSKHCADQGKKEGCLKDDREEKTAAGQGGESPGGALGGHICPVTFDPWIELETKRGLFGWARVDGNPWFPPSVLAGLQGVLNPLKPKEEPEEFRRESFGKAVKRKGLTPGFPRKPGFPRGTLAAREGF